MRFYEKSVSFVRPNPKFGAKLKMIWKNEHFKRGLRIFNAFFVLNPERSYETTPKWHGFLRIKRAAFQTRGGAHMRFRLAGTAKRLNVEHRTSNIDRIHYSMLDVQSSMFDVPFFSNPFILNYITKVSTSIKPAVFFGRRLG